MYGESQEPGGFIHQLPSPAPSSASISSTASSLPHPRSQPLRSGSAKEESARRYVETKLLHVARRYAKKFQPHEQGDAVFGYSCVKEVARDLGEVLDVLWLSGTPSLQIPYIMNIALTLTEYLTAFPPAPVPTFELLRKLDHAFSSLVQGQDSISGEPLPGFVGSKGGMTKTDMVRCKSLVESTRVLVVDFMSQEAVIEPDDDKEAGEETDAEELGAASSACEDTDHHMDVARVYQLTIVALGEKLDPPNFDA